MPVPVSWQGRAFNPVPESENRIHGDDVARAYGFRGGLVPGVVVSAYLAHPAAVAWGREWLERGAAHVTVASPVYDSEPFEVKVEDATAQSYRAELVDARGTRCATAEFTLPSEAPAPPDRRGDPPALRGAPRAPASREGFAGLRETGLRALHTRWDDAAEITRYLGESGEVAPVFREAGLASPAFVLALSNWVLAANAKLDAWLHLETRSQNFRALEPGVALVVEAAITDLFEKKGHHFVDLDVAVFEEPEGVALSRIGLRAIYRLRDTPAP